MLKTLKVGFDLDGVILYNPIRVFRPLAKKLLKPLKVFILHQKKDSFYLPSSAIEKLIWKFIHLSSFKVNLGYENLKRLSKNKNIELYLITGRYSFLENDYKKWLIKIEADKVFSNCYLNREDIQPNLFKENMIKKLKLDVYVEDNYDIIEKLNNHTGAKILWLTNLLDRKIPYNFKFDSLKEVSQYLKTLV